MKVLSVGVGLAWHLAAMEAGETNHQYVEKEHLFIGILSLKKMFMLYRNKQNSSEVFQALESEYNALKEIFREFNIEQTEIRRHIRKMLPKGDFKHISKTIHRSFECKEIFNRANKLAEFTDEISCLHLLSAILEKPGSNISKVIKDIGIEIRELQNELAKIIHYEKFRITPDNNNIILGKHVEISSFESILSMLRRLETSLRNFIQTELLKISQDWWNERIPQHILKIFNNNKLRRQRKRENRPWRKTKPINNIELLNFADYKDIILNKKNWGDVFEPIFKDKSFIIHNFDELEYYRNEIAHSRSLTIEDKEAFSVAAKKILNIIG